MRWKRLSLAGWGRNPRVEVQAARPERLSELVGAIGERSDNGLIAHGNGRSYGDQALNRHGHVVLTKRLNRLLAYDDASGLLECEPGVTFRDLLDVFLKRGLVFPVAPGTAFATIGGAVANDVHGKNHDLVGSFGDHVAWLDLVLASGETVRASPEENPDLFHATIGGGGLTGVISRICCKMMPAPSARVALKETRITDLDNFFAAFAEERERAAFSVGWIDALARGQSMGRGILEIGTFAAGDGAPDSNEQRKQRRIPIDFPSFALNSLSVRLFNRYYYNRLPEAGRERVVPLDAFLFPLDAVHDWNRIYGRRGFHQFQCVIPDAEARAGIGKLLEEISRSRSASFLAVLKTLGGEGRGHLSFPMRGYTLALDFPHRRGTAELFSRLEATTRDHGGRVYLAKDSLLSPEGFQAMYPRLAEFRQVLASCDPEGRFQSDLARRLQIRGPAP